MSSIPSFAANFAPSIGFSIDRVSVLQRPRPWLGHPSSTDTHTDTYTRTRRSKAVSIIDVDESIGLAPHLRTIARAYSRPTPRSRPLPSDQPAHSLPRLHF